MLCEKTDNEASGSTEALAATLTKYNFKKHKNNGKYSNTKNRVNNKNKNELNHAFTNPVRPSLERRALKQEIDSASTTLDEREFQTGRIRTAKTCCLTLIRTLG